MSKRKLVEVYKETNDNWHPSFSLDQGQKELVNVSFRELNHPSHEKVEWRVCVWGNDDYGMERDYDTEEEAWKMFVEVISEPVLSSHLLKKKGFVQA